MVAFLLVEARRAGAGLTDDGDVVPAWMLAGLCEMNHLSSLEGHESTLNVGPVLGIFCQDAELERFANRGFDNRSLCPGDLDDNSLATRNNGRFHFIVAIAVGCCV